MMNIIKAIDSILVTEKSTFLREKSNCITVLFSSRRVTKLQVKNMIQYAFSKVRIKSIRSITLHPKVKIFRGKKGVRVRKKKMIISFYSNDDMKAISSGV